MKKFFNGALLFFAALIVLGPILSLAFSSIVEIIKGKYEVIMLPFLVGRRLALFTNSMALSLLTAASTILISIIIASLLWQTNKKIRVICKWILLLTATIPSYVHVIAWTSVFKLIEGVTFRGWFACIWVGAMALLPIGVGLALISFESIETELWEAGRIISNDTRCFVKIILPPSLPSIFAGASLIFLINLMNYSIPSLFGINVYALEIFAEYSATNEPIRAFMLSLPLLVVAFLLLYFSQGGLRNIMLNGFNSKRDIYPKIKWPNLIRLIQAAGIVLFVTNFLIPIITLFINTRTFNDFFSSITSSKEEIAFSLKISALAAIIAVPIAAFIAKKMLEGIKYKKIWWLVITLPVAIPAPLIGIGLISLWNHRILSGIYNTTAMPVIAVISRFLTFAIIIMLVHYKAIDKRLLESAQIIQKNPIKRLIYIEFPMIAPGLVTSFAIIFILALGELGATLIVTPPGYNTLTVKIYNYMHYGASASVAGLCLAMVIFVLVMGLIIPTIIKIIKVLPSLFSIYLYKKGREHNDKGK